MRVLDMIPITLHGKAAGCVLAMPNLRGLEGHHFRTPDEFKAFFIRICEVGSF